MLKNTILAFLVISLAFSVTTSIGTATLLQYSPGLNVSVETNKQSYYIRENVSVHGNLILDQAPATEGLVGVQINDLGKAVVIRTSTIETITSPSYINILSVIPCDNNGIPKNSFKRGELAYVAVTIQNTAVGSVHLLITVNIYDKNNIPLGVSALEALTPPGIRDFTLAVPIPYFALTGNATVYANACTTWPKDGGVPYCSEKSASFTITSPYTSSMQTISKSATFDSLQLDDGNGAYSLTFKLSPETMNGTYEVSIGATSIGWKAYSTTSFEVESASYPPQASFTYYPSNPYTNATVTFDASASTAEGFLDEIVNYAWDFGDGTKANTANPIYYKTTGYKQPGTYIVMLNVTDTKGLWCTTSKPITILPPTGPTANFIWSPLAPVVNKSVVFDASSSILGWNGTGPAFIVSYKWDFGDSNITTVTTPIISHVFKAEGNYTVTLTVTDTQGFQSSKTKTVSVSSKIEGDVDGDGKVTLVDLVFVAKAYGSKPGDSNWDPRCDLDGNGQVGLSDLVIIAKNYGRTA